MKVKQLSVFAENQPGRLATMTRALSEAGINILAMTIAEISQFGVIRLIVPDFEKGMDALNRAGFTVITSDVLVVEIPDRPGGLAEVLTPLAARGINVEYMYAFAAHRQGRAIVAFCFDDPNRAAELLAQTGVPLLRSSDLAAL